MKLRSGWSLAAAAMILAALAWVGCDGDEELEPAQGEGLSIDISPVVVCTDGMVEGTAEVEVTLFDQAGDPIVGEEIVMAVTPGTGSLSDCALATPCTTDAEGKVTVTFSSSTPDTYTVIVTGGTLTSSAFLSVQADGTDSLTLAAAATDFDACSLTAVKTLPVTGVLLDDTSAPVSGAVISLEIVGSTGGLEVSFRSVPVVTASDGSYTATLEPVLSTCAACVSPAVCDVTVKTRAGCGVESPDLLLTESF